MYPSFLSISLIQQFSNILFIGPLYSLKIIKDPKEFYFTWFIYVYL